MVESHHRRVIDARIEILFISHMPLSYQPFARKSAIYTLNRVPSKIMNYTSPYFYLYGTSPYWNFLKKFGCPSFPCLRPSNNNKLQARSSIFVFLGYDPNHKDYLCMDMTTKNIITSRHVLFSKDEFPFQTSIFSSFEPTSYKLALFMYLLGCLLLLHVLACQ